jgi:hypothetical protein
MTVKALQSVQSSMSHHRIYGSEADQPRPLAYIKMFRTSRRKARGYVVAAVIGGLLALALAAGLAVVGGGLITPGA